MTYAIGNTPAAVAYQGSDYRTFVMGFPLKASGKKHPEM